MIDNINTKWIMVLLIGLLVNTYILKIEILDIILIIMLLGIIVYSNRHILKKLSIWQNLGILLLLLGTIVLMAGFLYYIANPVVNLISTQWIRNIAIVAIILGILVPAIGLLYKGMSKITKGKFPVTDIELVAENIDYPINEAIQQLVNEGKIVEAVKKARELYGYSLLEAKHYVDNIK